jgi:hypothetical protein
MEGVRHAAHALRFNLRLNPAPDLSDDTRLAQAYVACVSDKPKRLDDGLKIERTYDPNPEAMLAALRAVLGLPRRPPSLSAGGDA